MESIHIRKWNGLLIPFTALAYSVGIIFEYIGELFFSKLEDRIKKERLEKYIKANLTSLYKSPILAQAKAANDLSTDLHGEMRYYILGQSTSLYEDIETQVNRFRLLRVLFIVEILFFVCAVKQFIGEPSSLMIFFLGLLATLILVNYAAVYTRLQRYCRSIERSYKSLVLDKPAIDITENSAKRSKAIARN